MATGGSDKDFGSFNIDLSMDHYSLLQVGRDASTSEIKQAYLRQSLKYHPDKTLDSSSEEIMKRLNEAKTVLLNVERRSDYDDTLDEHGALCDPKGYLPSSGKNITLRL